jgi:hypothetical protein
LKPLFGLIPFGKMSGIHIENRANLSFVKSVLAFMKML